jgi:hypothetical protein
MGRPLFYFRPSCFLIASSVPLANCFADPCIGKTARLPRSSTLRWPPFPAMNVHPCLFNHLLNSRLVTRLIVHLSVNKMQREISTFLGTIWAAKRLTMTAANARGVVLPAPLLLRTNHGLLVNLTVAERSDAARKTANARWGAGAC